MYSQNIFQTNISSEKVVFLKTTYCGSYMLRNIQEYSNIFNKINDVVHNTNVVTQRIKLGCLLSKFVSDFDIFSEWPFSLASLLLLHFF